MKILWHENTWCLMNISFVYVDNTTIICVNIKYRLVITMIYIYFGHGSSSVNFINGHGVLSLCKVWSTLHDICTLVTLHNYFKFIVPWKYANNGICDQSLWCIHKLYCHKRRYIVHCTSLTENRHGGLNNTNTLRICFISWLFIKTCTSYIFNTMLYYIQYIDI